MGGFLGEDVEFVLEVGELGARGLGGGFAGVEDFGAEFGAGGAEEVGFLFLFLVRGGVCIVGGFFGNGGK